MASIAVPRINAGILLSRRQRNLGSSATTMSRLALLTRGDVSVPASTSAGEVNEIVVRVDEGGTEGPIPEWVLPTAEAFADILELRSGWNSYSARPIDRHAVEAAGALLAIVMEQSTPTPVVVPTVRGGIQLEWHRNGVDIEIAVNPSDPITVYAADAETGTEWEGEWTPGNPALSTWIQRL